MTSELSSQVQPKEVRLVMQLSMFESFHYNLITNPIGSISFPFGKDGTVTGDLVEIDGIKCIKFTIRYKE